ncbi:SLC13 family permease [Euzebya tangerina]|uniref:SLC13 family permease n=1 Tax=Euzebya tangerina TaxID=591198 RepID=UPI000E31D1A1|nr:SLC13 family permease [Euzebya tangerina]
MGLEAWVTLAAVISVLVVLGRGLAPAAVTVLGAVVGLLVLGVLTPEQAFSGFSNPAPITVAALYVLAGAVELTGVLETVIGRVLGRAGGQRGLLARVVGPTIISSAVLNNTPIVAMVAPAVANWAESRSFPASRFLMPVSFAAILGGTITAIGTSTNLVVSGLLVEAEMPALGLFELAAVGLPLALIGGGLIVLLAPIVLPDRGAVLGEADEVLREFTVAMTVVGEGALDGQTMETAGLRALQGVYCAQILRGDRTISPVRPDQGLRGGDELLFVGKVDRILDLQRNRGLRSAEDRHLDRVGGTHAGFFEAVVGPGSPLVGTTLKAIGFRQRHNAAVLAIHRAGQRVDAKLGEVEIRAGDALLVLAAPAFGGRWRSTGDFVLVAGTGTSRPLIGRKAQITGVVALLLVLLAGTGVVPILEASLVAAMVLFATRVISVRQARDAIDLQVLIVIASSFGLGAAVQASGLADVVADGLLQLTGPFGQVGALVGVLLVTMVLTELLTNNAAAVLVFPVGLAAAAQVGAEPRAFAITVALGASLSFLSPIGYQTNLMVYSLGGYRFTDFARLGAPITMSVLVAVAWLVPAVWPL